jgi:aromatic ring-opening dioxygenase LigB subunit
VAISEGAIVPHAPLLLADVSGAAVSGAAKATIDAMRSIDLGSADAVIVVTPHGSRTGVHAYCRGSLASFGRPDVVVNKEADAALATAIAAEWDEPVVEDDIDHGAVVPLRMLDVPHVPVIVCALADSADPAEAIEKGSALAGAVSGAARSRDLFLVASVTTSTALSDRAPLTERPAGAALDEAIFASLERGGPEVPADLWGPGGSCAAGPLAAWRALFPGGHRKLSYEFPYGVGYLVSIDR